MRKTLAAFAATITGKIVLGTTVAAAAVGGAAATGVVDLPDQAQRPEIVETAEAAELPEQAQQNQENSDDAKGADVEGPGEGPGEEAFGANAEGEVPEFVTSYLTEVEAWVECVRTETAAKAGDPEYDLDLHAACGGLDGPDTPGEGVGEGRGEPNEAAEQRSGNAGDDPTEGQSNAPEGRGNAPEAPADQGASQAEAGQQNADDAPAASGEDQGNVPEEAGAAGNRP